MTKYTAALLDIDGTLVDSNDAHANSWAQVFAKHGFKVPADRIRPLIGMGGDRMVKQLTGLDDDDPKAQEMTKERVELFTKEWLPRLEPMPGSRELVLKLREAGIKYAIASAANSEHFTPLLEVAKIADLVDPEKKADNVERSKPNPETIEAALATISGHKAHAVMIGDTPYDIEAARRANVDTIAFLCGGWTREALGGAIAIYDDPAALVTAWDESPFSAG